MEPKQILQRSKYNSIFNISASFTKVRTYASCVCLPTNILEKVQQHAARWVISEHNPMNSVTCLLDPLNWKTLQIRRSVSHLNLLYKVLHHQIYPPCSGDHIPTLNNISQAIPEI